MHVAVIADAYPPLRTSAAVQLKDLVAEFTTHGHAVTVILPDATLEKPWIVKEDGALTILRLKAPRTKDVNYFRRAIAEYFLSGAMLNNYKKSPLLNRKFEGIVWYSPTIFLGQFVEKLKKISACPTYLILRDIFPEWAVDMGLLSRGLIYSYFKRVEKFQYKQANYIGVQTPSNFNYFNNEQKNINAKIEVLNNWLSEPTPETCSIQSSETQLAGRKIFVYTGNIGIAQGMDILIDLANEFKNDDTAGFVFVGRGSALEQIKQQAASYELENILFYDEINPNEIPSLLAQCHVGLIALDPRHRNDNIPGKFLAYMQAGLPVLANINAGNDLEALVNDHKVGYVVTNNSLPELKSLAKQMIEVDSHEVEGLEMKNRCQQLAGSHFSSAAAVQQIVSALTTSKKVK
jgi:glycosyltransferase involved in cell wall biosynthesis